MVAVSRADRGRVPFALIGVLLLVSSATIVATTRPQAPPPEPDVSKALDRTTAETRTALAEAAREASEDAAHAPVVDRANTSAGRVLNESSAFRDSLRIRIYLAARDRLERIDRHRDGVRVRVSLPPASNATALREAKRRVHVERADANGTTLRVRFENVTVSASRDGRTLTERRLSPTLVVGTPVLAMHDRVSAYQKRLDAGVTEPGLDQRLTAQLYGIAWARGYGQYAGLPIDNVVTNRHVAVATNAGLLDVQRAIIGHSDPAGRRTLAVASAKTAGSDLLTASGRDAPTLKRALDEQTKPAPNEIRGVEPPNGTRPEDRTTVGVNRTADDAFFDLVDEAELNETLAATYGADVRLVSDVDRVGGRRPSVPGRPLGNWTLVDKHERVDTDTSEAAVPPPRTPTGWHRLERYGREVAVERTRVREWRRGNVTRTTTTRATERFRVSVAVVGRHSPGGRAPERGVSTAHERGAGPLSGPNLADVRDEVVDRLVAARGGPDAVVARAATGTLGTEPVRVQAARPAGLFRWTYRDLMTLRERVRDVAVTVERGKVGTFGVNPPSMLADRLRERRTDLVDAPATYGSAADRARVAARVAYFDRVVTLLDERAAARQDRGANLDNVLEERGVGSLSTLRKDLRASAGPSPDRRPALAGPAGPVRLRVDGAPSYLTQAEIDRDRVPALAGDGHPLVARNVNVFTVPYGDVTDTVFDGLFGSGGRVRLGTAARTLRAANATLDRRSVAEVRERRNAVRREVSDANAHVRGEMRATLAKRDVGETPGERGAIVDAGLDRWESTHAHSLAMTNGSASDAVAAAAAERVPLSATKRDRLRLALERRTRAALDDENAMPNLETVNRSRTATRDVASEVTKAIAENASKRGVEYAMNRSFDGVPSGLPLAPPVAPWYATTNVWHVTVRGEYARFGVRADRGRPTSPGAGLTYARDGSAVTLDVDDDGERERLGRATRVDFDVSTTVVVVVPPGKSGVGDRNGDADERSDGWPEPGPT